MPTKISGFLVPTCLGICAAIAMVAAKPAQAVPITFDFSGVVTSVPTGFNPPFFVGQTYSGSYTFESTAADQDATATFGTYENISSYTFNFGAGTYVGSTAQGTGTSAGRITVTNSVADSYLVFAAEAPELVNGPDAGGAEIVGASLFLLDLSGTAFADDSLPLTPPPLGAFGPGTFSLAFGNDQQVVSSVTSLTLRTPTNPVPEPAAMTIFAVGLAGLGFAMRRRQF